MRRVNFGLRLVPVTEGDIFGKKSEITCKSLFQISRNDKQNDSLVENYVLLGLTLVMHNETQGYVTDAAAVGPARPAPHSLI